MNVIIDSNQSMLNAFGGIQILIPGKKYRLNRYVMVENFEDRIVLYNGFTRSLIDMNEEEYNNCINVTRDIDYVDYFFSNYFVVPEDYDETKVLREVMEKAKTPINEDTLKKTHLYTILTTTGCNARCFYCYEKGIKTKTMNQETAEKIATLIVRRYNQYKEKVQLHWFGGEPTLNYKVIDTICEILKANNVDFYSDIISNGYLFNEELAKKSKELWNVETAQITVDGTAEVYNKTKAFIYKDDPNPFKTVIGNIRNLISNGIRVLIRLNVDLYNAEDLKKLIPQIYEEFGPDQLITIYTHLIFEGYGVNRTEEHLKKAVDAIIEIDDVLDQYGYTSKIGNGNGIPNHHCMSDGGHAITFSPDGYIGLCEHYVDKEFVGHIDDPENFDMEVVKKFREREEDLDICSDCSNYVDCIRLSMCEDLCNCNEQVKRWRENQIRKKVIATVRSYYRNMNNCNCQNPNYDLAEIKESLRILHNKIDTIFNILTNRR